ncbi:MAG: ankyrin repeat domain-containing protein [Pseudomonadota bacterium]
MTIENKKPPYIYAAEEALDRVKDQADYGQLQKKLPGLAARLHQAGEEVSVDRLTAAAAQGADHVDTLVKQLKAAQNSKKRSYDDIIAGFAQLPQSTGFAKNIPEDSDERLAYHATSGHIDAVKDCLENDSAGNRYGLALNCAAGNDHTELTTFLLNNGADQAALKNSALVWTAYAGHTRTIDLLVKHGADLNTVGSEALEAALENKHYETAFYFLQKGVETDALSQDDQATIGKIKKWAKTAGAPPPTDCLHHAPTLFKDKATQKCFKALDTILKREGLWTQQAAELAFASAVLFKTEDRALKYLEKWGQPGKQPLHDVLHMVKLPTQNTRDVDFQAWGGASVRHGPKMARLLKFAYLLPRPHRSRDMTNWQYRETLRTISRSAYRFSNKNRPLSGLFLRYAKEESAFNKALELVNQTPQPSRIPDISFTLPNGLTYRKLDDNDYRGLVLGEMTSCCQSIGSIGEHCARHGYISENGGFYVVEDRKGNIIGQSWAWLSTEDDLVLDSLESQKNRLTGDDWQHIIDHLSQQVEAKATQIKAVYIGTGGNTPDLPFNQVSGAQPKDYKGSRDSDKSQYQVFRRKSETTGLKSPSA